MPAEVFFTDLRAKSGNNLLDKVGRLFDRAGLADLIKPQDLVAVKLHFGERGNLAFIRPQFVRKIVDRIKAAGGKPFLTDAGTLYVGSRANAVDHVETALDNGFAYATVGAPVVIADGLKGHDYVTVPIGLKHFQEARVASAACQADALIAVTHFKGHEATGFGGVFKNIGMGLGTRAAKQSMHSDVLPKVDPEKCVACGRCTEWCPAGAITIDETAQIDPEKCLGCGECTITCVEGAVGISFTSDVSSLQEKIVEYAYAVLKNKKGKAGFISFVVDVSPNCDCWNYNDTPIVPDVGILAGTDPVAIEQACIDLVNAQPSLPNSAVNLPPGADKFRGIYHDIDWNYQLAYGEQIGLGSRNYRLIKL
jgi:uncharacterized Fe-S center protein